VYKIVQDPYDPIPERYSPELSKLVASILTKDDSKRPTVSKILETPYLEKYMQQFIKEREAAAKKERFESLASATAYTQKLTIPKVDPSKKVNQVKQKLKPKEVKKRELTAKERMQLRKEQERQKQFEMMSSAAKTATQNFYE
jgi:hypothetical protein